MKYLRNLGAFSDTRIKMLKDVILRKTEVVKSIDLALENL